MEKSSERGFEFYFILSKVIKTELRELHSVRGLSIENMSNQSPYYEQKLKLNIMPISLSGFKSAFDKLDSKMLA